MRFARSATHRPGSHRSVDALGVRGALPPTGLIVAAATLPSAALLALLVGGGAVAGAFLLAFLSGIAGAAGWMAMAFGLGWPLRRLLDVRGPSGAAIQLALGVAAALWLDVALGTLGVLSTSAGAAALLALGCVLAGACLLRDRPAVHPMHPVAIVALPAVAALVLAATSAPGWLWSTEFGGYDALSYHLELPKRWHAEGAIGAVPHSVYGHLPSFVESAFLHLIALGGDAHRAAVACQLLHAMIAIAAAWTTGQAAAAWSAGPQRGAIAAAVGFGLVLATPWVAVTGSLAYNEMAVVLFLAAGLAVLAAQRGAAASGEARTSTTLGILAGAACGAKLTAAGFVALPLALLLALRQTGRGAADASERQAPCDGAGHAAGPRAAVRMAAGRMAISIAVAGAAMALAAAFVLLPWFIRNGIATGNPLFPFATSLLGSGHWGAEQSAIFTAGHASSAGFGGRAAALWEQFMIFGLGPAPEDGEPWRPQWGALPWLGLAAIAWLSLRGSCRAGVTLALVLLMQIGFWLLATHLKSRFLLPAVAPLAIAAAVSIAPATAAQTAWWRRPRSLGVALCALALGPLALLFGERGGAPFAAIGAESFFTGDVQQRLLDRATPHERERLLAEASMAWWLNHGLPIGSHVLLLGDARPFWYRGEPASYAWQTTWDRGPFSAALAASDDPSEWRRRLREAGFTHVLVDPEMLARWERSGWNDPQLTATAALRLIDRPERVIARGPGGLLLTLDP
ncbi:MAG TPA: hypothetical protein PKC43_05740 [Phycisphaerales bacterium]|nr:hypothetical protein [Phycisphaerales bacterium]HMP36934.1 hypothetical protein [Phycisphaerales bacterium]